MKQIIAFVAGVSAAIVHHANCQTRSEKTYDKHDFYFSTSMTFGIVQNIFPTGDLKTNFTYQSTDLSGKTTTDQFTSNWSSPAIIKTPYGGQINLEFGNHSKFLTIGVGGFETIATHFSVGAGANIYIPVNFHSIERCLVIKPSLSFGVGQSTPFGRGGNELYLLGAIDNVNKTINALGYEFDPTYTIHATKYQPARAANVTNLDVYFMENYTYLFPKISIGRNNNVRFLNFPFDVGYFVSLHQNDAIQLFQDKYYSGTTIWVNDDSSLANFNGQPISKLPSLINGLFVGFTVGLNFSREVFQNYVNKSSKDCGKICRCIKRRIKKENRKSRVSR